MNLFTAYIPMDRRQALAQGKQLPEQANGAALFADISGFTPLTAALVQELGARRGAEELTRYLNLVYNALIEQVHAYQGSVVIFSGDAITCWFDDGAHELIGAAGGDAAAGRAVACAQAMQTTMRQFATVETAAGTPVSLAIKIAAAAGQTRRFLVGDPDMLLLDILAGAPLDNMAAAEKLAQKGEIVVDGALADALGQQLVINEWRKEESDGRRFAVVGGLAEPLPPQPWPSIAPGAITADQSRPWLLSPVYERLQGGQGQFLAELRPAVALFLKFGGLDYEQDEAAGAKLDAYIRWAQSIFNKYEGFLLQVIIGDKGSYFYAAFGAPVSHDDDPARAVAAAMELRRPPNNLAYIKKSCIGISQGRLRVGAYGGQTRRAYGVIGEEVNLAARLMGQAQPGQILARQQIAEATSQAYRSKYLGIMHVKGKPEPIPIFQILERLQPSLQRPSSLFRNPLVGREAELEQLTPRLEDVLDGKGQIIRLQGDAGVGKSHLAAELVERALERGMRIATGHCQSMNQGTAYAPWREIFRTLLGLHDDGGLGGGGMAAVARHIAQVQVQLTMINPDWQLRLPLLGQLLDLPIPENATTAALDPRVRQESLFALVVEMIQTWANEQPLILMLEDIHWMDEISLALTQAVGRASADLPIFLLLAQRPSPQDNPLLPDMSQLSYHYALNLNQLTPAGVAALTRNQLQGEPSPLALSLIQNKTQGNPFFVEELVDALRESGVLYEPRDTFWTLSETAVAALRGTGALIKQNGDWLVAEDAAIGLAEMGIPDSVYATVLSRIDRLSEDHKLTLKVASVIGRLFELNLLAHIHPLHQDKTVIDGQLQEIAQRDFLRLRAEGGDDAYFFKHNTMQEVAYDTLLFAQQRQLHQAASAALIALSPDDVARIAYHAFVGEDWPRALQYHQLAGQRARQLFANGEAIDHFRKALRSADKLPPTETQAARQEIHTALGELFTHTGDYTAAREHLDKALALAAVAQDRSGEAKICRCLARLYEYQGEYDAALSWIDRGLSALEGEETADSAELLTTAGLINVRRGDYALARQKGEQIIPLAERLGDAAVSARAYALLAMLDMRQGNNDEAINTGQKAINLYKQAENTYGQALMLNSLANVYFTIGQWAKASAHYRQALQIFSQMGDLYNCTMANNNLGGIAMKRGHLDEARQFYEQGRRDIIQIGGSPFILGVLEMNLGDVNIRLNNVPQALTHLQNGQGYFQRAQIREFLPELHRLFAQAALVDGRLTDADNECQQSLELARELGMRGEEGMTLRVWGEIALAQTQFDLAESRLLDSLTNLDEVGDAYESARAQFEMARLRLAQGRPQESAAALNLCLPIFERLGAALDLEKANNLHKEST